jgi:formylglycine-generating enzyme required for sulfatase activity
MKRGLLFSICCAGITATVIAASARQPAQAESSNPNPASRLALLIGNAGYPDAAAPLRQPKRSVSLLADELRRLGFEVDAHENLGQEGMRRALDALKKKIKPHSTVLFFFSGYGLQFERQTFIIPVDAQIWTESDIARAGLSVEEILSEIDREGAGIKLMILDASRRNPYERRFRQLPAGLATIASPPGTLIISAASPRKVAADHDTAFIDQLVKEMREPGASAEKIFSRTRIGVARATKGEQVPWMASSLVDFFSFEAPPRLTSTTSPAGEARPPRAAESVRRPAAPPPRPTDRPTAVAPGRQTEATALPLAETGRRRLEPGDVFRDCGDCPEMVVVPPGDFRMGSDDFPFEQPVHRVDIPRAFAIGRREITFEQWDRCVDAGHCRHRPDDRRQGRGERPATDLSWVDAKSYIAWLSQKTGQAYRLPSEAEWEYAARGGTRTAFWWGRAASGKFANCRECGGETSQDTMATASFFANPFGLFDTAGNAAEWVEDCWSENYRDAPDDGSARTGGQCRQRVLRGGSFDSQARYLRSASRFRYDADVRYYTNGFRVARDVP